MSARRAVARWSVRMFRREWRQQVLVLSLVTVAVGAAIFVATLSYHAPTPGTADFGRANYRIGIAGKTAAVEGALQTARDTFGTIDVVRRHRMEIPGSTESLDVRFQDPQGVYTAPTITLLRGRYPKQPSEVAMTANAARLLDTTVGRTITIDRAPRAVVGLIENPVNLSDRFVLTASDLAPDRSDVEVFIKTTDGVMTNLPAALRPGPGAPSADRATVFEIAKRGHDENATAAALGFAMGTVVMLLVCLVAAAGFVVIAQRRGRQLGMLSAIGATDRHLRFVVLMNGVLVGAVAGVLGNALAAIAWVVLSSRLQHLVAHRWSGLAIPWWIPVIGACLAVVTAAAAAWWPARAVARTPVVHALSGRPPESRSVRISGVLAIALLVVGFLSVMKGFDVRNDRGSAPYAVLGMLAIAGGILFASPVAVRFVGRLARRLPLAPRLALRDLGRHQSRSGAALAAISLGVGVATAIVVIAAAVQYSPSKRNLSNQQLLVHLGRGQPGVERAHTDADITAIGSALQQLATSLGGGKALPLQVATSAPTESGGRSVALLVRDVTTGGAQRRTYRDAGVLYVATPELLHYLGIDDKTSSTADFLTTAPGRYAVIDPSAPKARPMNARVKVINRPVYGSLPHSLITSAGMARLGLEPASEGWLLDAPHIVTTAQQDAARQLGTRLGLVVETRDEQQSLATARTVSTGVGALLAFAILAMTVGLIRGEAAADLRTLTATGATGATRRGLAATTAGALALLGALLGAGGAYAALIAGYFGQLKPLQHVPVAHLAVNMFGVPFAAAVGGWLLAGHEPSAVARQPLTT